MRQHVTRGFSLGSSPFATCSRVDRDVPGARRGCVRDAARETRRFVVLTLLVGVPACSFFAPTDEDLFGNQGHGGASGANNGGENSGGTNNGGAGATGGSHIAGASATGGNTGGGSSTSNGSTS